MRLYITAIISIAFFGMLASFADEKTEPAPPKVGDTAPDWTLQDPEEKEHNLKKLRGKVVFLILGNRKIRKEDDKWAEAFQKDYRREQTSYRLYRCRYAERPRVHTETVHQRTTEEKPSACEIPTRLEGRGA